MESASPSYKGHRYPVEVISHCVWLYFRFPLSFREVEELMFQRGVIVSYETIRRWCAKFGQAYANGLRRRRPRPGDKWHLDEVFIKVNGERKYLWRAVDQDGNVLDTLVQNRRDKAAVRRFLRRRMKTTGTVPRVMVTDKLPSYGAAHREEPRDRLLLRRRRAAGVCVSWLVQVVLRSRGPGRAPGHTVVGPVPGRWRQRAGCSRRAGAGMSWVGRQ
ncbi:IS6 family transposase [Streptomyces sp. NPDC005262]|uniref:IS6 family transposase n=1 Tax=Streptomyces sp. NPDC005262 TaxID=3364710 RepID=UPI0036B80535